MDYKSGVIKSSFKVREAIKGDLNFIFEIGEYLSELEDRDFSDIKYTYESSEKDIIILDTHISSKGNLLLIEDKDGEMEISFSDEVN